MIAKIAMRLGGGPGVERAAVLAAQMLTLCALALALVFVTSTTGGTLFLFSSLAPALAFASMAMVLAVAIARFRRRHSLFEVQTYPAGHVIFRQGDAGQCAYFIQQGEVEVVREEGGRESVLARLGPGQYFGEMALLTARPRNATVRATAASRIAVLGKGNFLTLVQSVPSARADIMKTVQERAMRA